MKTRTFVQVLSLLALLTGLSAFAQEPAFSVREQGDRAERKRKAKARGINSRGPFTFRSATKNHYGFRPLVVALLPPFSDFGRTILLP